MADYDVADPDQLIPEDVDVDNYDPEETTPMSIYERPLPVESTEGQTQPGGDLDFAVDTYYDVLERDLKMVPIRREYQTS